MQMSILCLTACKLKGGKGFLRGNVLYYKERENGIC